MQVFQKNVHRQVLRDHANAARSSKSRRRKMVRFDIRRPLIAATRKNEMPRIELVVGYFAYCDLPPIHQQYPVVLLITHQQVHRARVPTTINRKDPIAVRTARVVRFLRIRSGLSINEKIS
jgi:hypothetical protein